MAHRAIKQTVLVIATVTVLGLAPMALATPGKGELKRTDIGRGNNPEGGSITFAEGTDTVVYSFTLAPGATSGWHRHPGAVTVVVKSGVLTTYGLSHEPCKGRNVGPGGVHFEKDAATARWPHFVRNLGTKVMEAVVLAYNVPKGGSARVDADAPAECDDPTEVEPTS
jgi:hypothetical protein